MPVQHDLTVLTPVAAGEVERLGEILEGVHDRMNEDGDIPFREFEAVHFIRWAILPEAHSAVTGTRYPARLVLSSSFDGERDEHLRELVTKAERGFDRIYESCPDYPSPAGRTPEGRMAFLRRHAIRVDTFYRGHPGVTVKQIRRQEALREAIEGFLDREDPPVSATAPEIRERIRKFVEGKASLRWALAPADPPSRVGLSAVEWILSAIAVVLFLPLAVVWMALIRQSEIDESWEPVSDESTGRTDRGAMLGREDFVAQNQFTHVVEIKPGWIRKITLRTILALVDFMGRRFYCAGQLRGVKTLHYVRWVIIDGGKRLLFLSDYDGSTLRYVGDFIDRSREIPWALTSIWSNTIGFPESRWLMFRGAADLPAFFAFLRDHQKHTQVWFSAYKLLTTGNIVNNEAIRRGLADDLDAEEAEEWLQRL